MQAVRLRFLTKEESPKLPFFFRFLPPSKRERLLPLFRPFLMEERTGEPALSDCVLQTKQRAGFSPQWKRAFSLLDTTLKDGGTAILIPPTDGEWKEYSLPLAKGEKLAGLFAFAGASEALKRKGKDPADASWLITGGDPARWEALSAVMGNEVNRLSLFTARPKDAAPFCEKLYRERGLVTEVFSSPKNPAFQKADAVLSCGMEQLPLEYLLKTGAFWLDLAGCRSVLRRLLSVRPDVTACEGFFFKDGEKQREGREAEALLFLKEPAFRRLWETDFHPDETFLLTLPETSLSVSGFSALGKRVKIPKNQGKNGFSGVKH